MTEYDSVKDSGERRDFGTGSVRDVRTGKGRYDLLEPYAIRRLAQHFENGAAKYGDDNWKLGQPLSGYLDSAIRHCFNVLEGKTDEDHAAAAAWNIMALISTKHWVDEGTLPSVLDDIKWDDEDYDPNNYGPARPVFVPPTREEVAEWMPGFEAAATVSPGIDEDDLTFEAAKRAWLLHLADCRDPHCRRAAPRVGGTVEEPADPSWVRAGMEAVAAGEDLAILSGDTATLLSDMIQAHKNGEDERLQWLTDDFMQAIDDVDKDKQDSVGSDRPTSTDQTGGNNVR